MRGQPTEWNNPYLSCLNLRTIQCINPGWTLHFISNAEIWGCSCLELLWTGNYKSTLLCLSGFLIFNPSLTWTMYGWNLMLFLHSATSIKFFWLLMEMTLSATSSSCQVFITRFQNITCNTDRNPLDPGMTLLWKYSKLQESREENINLQN